MAYRIVASTSAGERPAGGAYEKALAIRLADQLARGDRQGLTTYRVVDWREKAIYVVANDGKPGREI